MSKIDELWGDNPKILKIFKKTEWEEKMNLKVCRECMWSEHYSEIVENPTCKLGQTMGKICAGFMMWQTMLVICDDCCKRIALERLEQARSK